MARYDFTTAAAFQADVALDALVAAVLAMGAASLIGLAGLRLSHPDDDATAALTAAPALGLAILIVMADWVARIAGPGAVPPVALLLAMGAIVVIRHRRPGRGDATCLTAAALGCAALAAIAASWLFPRFDGDAMYFGQALYDHLKAAIIDTMAREGFPPRTPYISLDGAPIALNYYYGWHLLAAALRTLPGLSSLAVDISLTGVTTAATASVVISLAWRLRPAFSTVLATLAVLAGTTMAGVLRDWLPVHVTELFLARTHPIETVMTQAPWVPQHLAAAAFVTLAVHGLARMREQQDRAVAWRDAVHIGMLLAAAVMASAWVGAIALLATAMLALPFVLLRADLRQRLLSGATTILAAAFVALVLALGYLLYLRGLAQIAAQPLNYVAFDLFRTSHSVAPDSLFGALFQVANYATLFAATHLGLTYIAGLAGLYVWHGNQGAERAWHELMHIWVPSAMAMVLFLRSPLVHNDLGWRGILLAVLPLAAFAGAALASLADRVLQGPVRPGLKAAAVAATIVLLLSLAGTQREFSRFILAPLSAVHRDQHERMLQAGLAWQRVQALTRPDAIIMANPAAFDAVTRPGGNVAWALFGDRRLLLTDYEWGLIFAHHVREASVAALDREQTRIFDGPADDAAVLRLKAVHKVAAILVSPSDAIARTDHLTRAGHFRRAETVHGFEIFLATTP